jgi:hypothetical protein
LENIPFCFVFQIKLDFIRTQFEKQYNSLKRRVDETETDNERLTSQHRSATKELLLYKKLLEAPDNPESPSRTKDYQQLKLTIDAVLQENERLYAELHDFKTSDPVYEQVQLLETANQHLKQELSHLTNQHNRLKKMVNNDEIKHLKSRLTKSVDECEQLRLVNKKLLNEIELRQHQLQTSPSPKQVSVRSDFILIFRYKSCLNILPSIISFYIYSLRIHPDVESNLYRPIKRTLKRSGFSNTKE